ncbi:MAG: CoA pyrophosphatase [Rhodospirillaceae bacterium]|nr:CoA pyrophosphatase [Rhodospirillaceae bacterium]
MTAAQLKTHAVFALTRTEIAARLATPRDPVRARSDLQTAAQLLSAADLKPYEGRGAIAFASPAPPDAPRMAAAVLVPLVEREGGFSLILTQRNADLKAHAGQISFPGGRMEQEDANAEAAALREAHEEIGLDPKTVEILGRLDPYRTVTGFDVTPVVGAVSPPLALKPDPVEVAEIFEVPLAFFLDPANHQRHSRTSPSGAVRAYYAMPYQDRYIWGATAGMLVNLYEVLTAK